MNTSVFAQSCNDVFNLGRDTTLRCNDSLLIQAPRGFDSYLWNTGSSSSEIKVGQSGSYSCTAKKFGANQVKNGDFSLGNTGFSSNYSFERSSEYGLIGYEGSYTIQSNTGLAHRDFPSCGDHTNNGASRKMMIVNGTSVDNVPVWKQSISVQPNVNYEFSFWAMSAVSQNPGKLKLSINGVQIGNILNLSSNMCSWQNFFATWNSGSNTVIEISIVNRNIFGAGNDFAIDDIMFRPVCEYVSQKDVVIPPVIKTLIHLSPNVCDATVVSSLSIPQQANITYNWTPGNIRGTTYPVEFYEPTKITLTATDINGCLDSTSVVVKNREKQILDPLPDLYVCDNELIPDIRFTGNLSNMDYSWTNSNVLNGIPTSGQSPITGIRARNTGSDIIQSTIKVTSFTGTCFESSSFNIFLFPEIKLNGPNAFCVETSEQYSSNGVPALINPFTSSNTAIATVSNTGLVTGVGAGTVVITFTSSDGCQKTKTITIHPKSQLSISNPAVICQSDFVTMEVQGAMTYSWSPANNLNTATGNSVIFDADQTTTFTVTGIDLNGCISQVVKTIIVNNPIPFNVSDDQVICIGSSTVLLATGAVSYEWDNGLGNGNTHTVQPLIQTIYNVIGTDAIGCKSTQTIEISLNSLPTASITGTAEVCQNSTQPTLTFDGANGLAPYTFFYTLNGGDTLTSVSTGNTATINASTNIVGEFTYTLIDVLDRNNCRQRQTDTVQIKVNSLPIAKISSLSDVCLNDTEPVLIFRGEKGKMPYTFKYTVNGEPLQTVVSIEDTVLLTLPTVAAGRFVYTLVDVTDANSCGQIQNNSSELIVHSLPIVSAGTDRIICIGERVILSVSGVENGTFSWDNGVVNNVPFFPGLGVNTYSVSCIDINNCLNSDTVFIEVKDLPEVSFEVMQNGFCSPLAVELKNTSNATDVVCVWEVTGMDPIIACGNQNIILTKPGSYDVTLSLTSPIVGCHNSVLKKDVIILKENPIADFSYSPDKVTVIDNFVTFKNQSIGATSYYWDFDNGLTSTEENPSEFMNTEEGRQTVTLVATSQSGCKDMVKKELVLGSEFLFFMPNAFTPNGSELNDVFKPVFVSGLDIYDYVMYIYNRWGEIVFESHDAEVGWAGFFSHKQEQCPDGVYNWKIVTSIGDSSKDEHKVFNGSVTLIR